MFRIDCVSNSQLLARNIKCLQFLHYRIASSMRQSSYQVYIPSYSIVPIDSRAQTIVLSSHMNIDSMLSNTLQIHQSNTQKRSHKKFIFRQCRTKTRVRIKKKRVLHNENAFVCEFCEWI